MKVNNVIYGLLFALFSLLVQTGALPEIRPARTYLLVDTKDRVIDLLQEDSRGADKKLDSFKVISLPSGLTGPESVLPESIEYRVRHTQLNWTTKEKSQVIFLVQEGDETKSLTILGSTIKRPGDGTQVVLSLADAERLACKAKKDMPVYIENQIP